MFRRVGVLILSIGMMLVFAGPVSAQPWWCEDDPILHFSDGTSIHLTTSFSAANLTSSTVVTYDVHVPTGTSVTWTAAASQVASTVKWTADGPAGSASITVKVFGVTDFAVTQTGGGARKQSYASNGGAASFSVTIGG